MISSAEPALEPMVRVDGLSKSFPVRGRGLLARAAEVLAVEDVSFTINAGSTFGLVGESGSGKSTIARILLKLEIPSAGRVLVEGRDIFRQTKSEEKAYRRLVQAVLQDPYGALSPRMRVRSIVAEPLAAQGESRGAIDAAVPRLLEAVGLPSQLGPSYPHQFSGGQRQRIAIARALSVEPRLLVLDEPVSALDVSIRAQVLALLRDMQQRMGLTYLFIGHDLAVVNYLSARVGVLYFGRVVEIGDSNDVLRRPLHPYTRRLVAIAAMREPLGRNRLQGELPDPRNRPSGCHFRTRCPLATDICAEERPPLHPFRARRLVACHHAERAEEADVPPIAAVPG